MVHLMYFKPHASVAGKLIHQQHKEGLEALSKKSRSISLSFSLSRPLDLLLKPQSLMPLFTASRKVVPNISGRTEKHKSNFQTVSAQRTWNTKASPGAVCTVSALGSGPHHSLRKWTDLSGPCCHWTSGFLWPSVKLVSKMQWPHTFYGSLSL